MGIQMSTHKQVKFVVLSSCPAYAIFFGLFHGKLKIPISIDKCAFFMYNVFVSDTYTNQEVLLWLLQ